MRSREWALPPSAGRGDRERQCLTCVVSQLLTWRRNIGLPVSSDGRERELRTVRTSVGISSWLRNGLEVHRSSATHAWPTTSLGIVRSQLPRLYRQAVPTSRNHATSDHIVLAE